MSKPIDKTNILNYLKEHYSEFKNKYNVEQIGLFGSYARDEATENSDIDIFVKMKPSLFDNLSIFLKPSPIATNLIEILSSFSSPFSSSKKSSLELIFFALF